MPVDIIPGLMKALACLMELSSLDFWDRSLLYPRLEDNDSYPKIGLVARLL